MTTKMRSLRNFRNPIGCLILLAAFAAAAGCSTAESPSGSGTNMNHVLPSGSSVSGWLVVPSGGTHTSSATLDYIANGGSSGCAQCHGSDLSGGISKVSCFGNPAGCHHDPVAGWVAAPPAAQQHGVSAKKAPGSSGFASCQICHGADFRTGAEARPASPATPLRRTRRGRGAAPAYTHTDTNTSNATVCAQCHFPGSPNNPANHPATPAPAGTAPGCFNSTLCHGSSGAAHPVPFNDPAHYVGDHRNVPGELQRLPRHLRAVGEAGTRLPDVSRRRIAACGAQLHLLPRQPAERRCPRRGGVSEHRRRSYHAPRPEQRGDPDLLRHLPLRAGRPAP